MRTEKEENQLLTTVYGNDGNGWAQYSKEVIDLIFWLLAVG